MIDLVNKRFVFFDSLGGRNLKAIAALKRWLADEAKVPLHIVVYSFDRAHACTGTCNAGQHNWCTHEVIAASDKWLANMAGHQGKSLGTGGHPYGTAMVVFAHLLPPCAEQQQPGTSSTGVVQMACFQRWCVVRVSD